MYNEEDEKKKYREYMKQMEMKKGLIQQIEEHKYNKKKAKEYNNNTYVYNTIQDNCNKGNCTCCNNKYPINLLNYRKCLVCGQEVILFPRLAMYVVKQSKNT